MIRPSTTRTRARCSAIVASVAQARPSAVDAALLASIRDASRAFHPAALAAFDGTAAAPARAGVRGGASPSVVPLLNKHSYWSLFTSLGGSDPRG